MINPLTQQTLNSFCATGAGGGIDPTCGKGGSKSSGGAKAGGKSKLEKIDSGDYEPEVNQQEIDKGQKVLGTKGFQEAGGGDSFTTYIKDGKSVYHFDDGSWEHHSGDDFDHSSKTLLKSGKNSKSLGSYLK